MVEVLGGGPFLHKLIVILGQIIVKSYDEAEGGVDGRDKAENRKQYVEIDKQIHYGATEEPRVSTVVDLTGAA